MTSAHKISALTLACHECEIHGLRWTDSAVWEGSDHHRVLCLSLESRYLSSGVCLFGDNDDSICPCDLIREAPSTSGWRRPGQISSGRNITDSDG